jgi:two-component system, chemotaxis family, sensor kinase CheA
MAQDPYRYFRVEARELVDQLGRGLLDLEKGAGGEMVAQLLRLAHTLKGAARVVKQPAIADHAHAIEGVLEPYRGAADAVAGEAINEVLKYIDQIAGGVAALSKSAEAKPAADAGSPPVEDSFRTIRTEVEEVDALLDGVSETFTRLNALRDAIGSIERAGHVADVLAGQLTLHGGKGQAPVAAARADRTQAMAEELRTIVSGLERNLGSACDRMARELHQVRDIAEQLRLVPAGTLFTSLERAARDAAHALGKAVNFEGKGGDVRLDAHVLRTVQEALTQIVRNAVAHGIETKEARVAAGKPAAGHIAFRVERRGRRVVFRCEDDGRGVDLEAVRSVAQRKGLSPAEIDKLDVDGLVRMLLRGGLSTSASVTEVSGRGIGMDIVRESVERLGGDVSVRTEIGRGTTFELVVPISLTALDALVVESSGGSVTIPLDAVRHTQRITPRDVSRTARGESIVVDDKAVPFVQLSRMLRETPSVRNGRDVSAVVVAGASGIAAIGVDRLLGTANVILRALPDLAPADAVVAGASLDAEGNPQLVLDPDGLVGEALREAGAARDEEPDAQSVLVVDDSLTTRMLEQSILESAGYQVDLAVSGEEALETARRKKYALFLVDVEMPGMDGFTFIECIRADAALRDIPAILVTSLASPEDIKRGEAVGAQGYMIKSEFDQAQLLARIRQLAA